MVRKGLLHRVMIVWVLVLSMLLPQFGTAFAEVVTLEGYAMLTFGKKDIEENMTLLRGTPLVKTVDGKGGRVLSTPGSDVVYLMCNVDDEFLKDIPQDTPIDVTVEYFDSTGGGSFTMVYDSYNPQPEYNTTAGNDKHSYREADACYLEGTETWRTHTWTLEDMRMSNGLSAGDDLRICTWGVFMGYSKADVTIGSIKVNVGEYKNPTNVIVDSDERIGNIFSDRDEKISLNVNIQNKTYNPVKGEYSVRIYDKKTLEEVHTASFEASIGAKESEIVNVTFANPGKNAIYTIDIEETVWYEENPDEKKTRVIGSECSVAMLSEKGEGNPFYGHMNEVVNSGRGYTDEVYELMASTGATWNREEYGWRKVEQQRGQLVLPEEAKEAWRKQKEAGIEFMFLCLGTNPHYDGGMTPASDEAVAAFANYCAFMAKELKGITNYFEIWNEWNIVGFNPSNEPPETYAKLLKASYKAIKEVNPDAVVVGVSTALIDLNWTRRVFEAGGYEYLDAVSIHPYDFSGKFREEKFIKDGLDLKNLMQEYGEEKPIYYSELGFSTVNGPVPTTPGYLGYSQTEQAAAKILSNAVMRGYDLCDAVMEFTFYDRNNQKDLESCWGVAYKWDVTNVPYKPRNGAKESFLAVCAMNRLWGANTEFKDKIVKDRAYAMNFYNSKDQRNVLVLATGEGEETLNIDIGIKSVDIYDMLGNKTATLHSDNGVYAFGVNMVPYYVVGNFTKFEESSRKGAITPDSISQVGTANDIVSFKFTKNISDEMIVSIGEAPGITVAENKGFKGNTATVVLKTSKDAMGEKTIPISISGKNGKLYYYADHRLQLKDPITISISSQRVSNTGNNHWAAKVTVHNNSQAGRHNGEVQLVAPEESALKSRTRSFSSLAPGKDAVFLFNLPVNIVKKPVDVSVKVMLEGGLEFECTEKLVFTTAKYTESKPVIDGIETTGEWHKNWFGVNEQKDVKLIEGWKGPDDLSFNATMMWDEENLYMLAVVRDTIHSVQYSPPTEQYMWNGDCIQFSVDDRDVIPAWQEGEFTELGIAQLPSGKSGAYRWSSLYDDLPEQVVVEGAEVAVNHKDGVTIYECRMPWSEIFYEGYEVNPEGAFKFSAMANDNDGAGRRGWIEYMSGIGSPKNAGLFGKLILEK